METKVYKCDRCGAEGKNLEIRVMDLKPQHIDLCVKCAGQLRKWIECKEEESGLIGLLKGHRYVEVESQCRHHVPCAGPCGPTLYKRVP